ncbi:hypothetical protein REPUB_Repub13aG0248300 [Reevesia pubescens]
MGVQENGNNKKYERMGSESDAAEEEIVLTNNLQYKKAEKEGVIVNDFSDNTRKYVFACAIFASLNSVLLGYDVGVMSGAIIFIQEDLKISEVQEEVRVGILGIVSILGSLAGGKTSDVIGRLLAGIGIGFGVMIAPVYIVEISPSIARGSLTSFPEIFVNLGILLGYISNYAFSGLPVHINWRIMLGVGILPSVFVGFALFIIPESPRWLVMQNRIEEARFVLSKTYENESEVEDRLAEIQIAAGIANADKYEEKAITGIDATVYYSPTIFKDAGIKGNTELLAATVAVGFTKTMFILIAIFLIDKVGRKPLLYVSTIGMTLSLFCLSFTLTYSGDGRLGIGLAILFVCANVAFFSVGIGPVCWVLSSEIFPLRLRAQASGLGAVGSRVSSGLVCMSFLSMSRALTVGGTFFVFFMTSALSIAFVHTRVPETKGKSLEQIEMLFQNVGECKGGEVEIGDAKRLVQKL